jgi:hypothetical protein
MNYTTSKDYEELWRLVQDGKEIVCFVTEKENRFTGLATWFKNSPELGGDGFFITAHKKIILLALNQERLHIECKRLNLEFLSPNAWIKIESDKDLPPKIGIDCEVLIYSRVCGVESVSISYLHGKDYLGIPWREAQNVTHWMPMPESPKE